MRRYSAPLVILLAFIALALVAVWVFVYRARPGTRVTAYRGGLSRAQTAHVRLARRTTTLNAQLAAARPAASVRGAGLDPPAIIDGSKEPQLIPDVVAYRLWFVAVALLPGATAAEERRQRAQLMTAGLKGDDVGRAASALATFKTSYGYLVGAYNDSIAEANKMGEDPPDVQAFLGQRDALVETTRDALNSALSVPGMQALRAYVQGQKANMRVAEGDK